MVKKIAKKKSRKYHHKKITYFHVSLLSIVAILALFFLISSFTQLQAANLSTENDTDIYDSSYNNAPIDVLKKRGDRLINDRLAMLDVRIVDLKGMMPQLTDSAISLPYIRTGFIDLQNKRDSLSILKSVIDNEKNVEDVRKNVHSIFTLYRINRLVLRQADIYLEFANLEIPTIPVRGAADQLKKRILQDFQKTVLDKTGFNYAYTTLLVKIFSPLNTNETNKIMNDADKLKVKMDTITSLTPATYISDTTGVETKLDEAKNAIEISVQKMNQLVQTDLPPIATVETQLDTYLKDKENIH